MDVWLIQLSKPIGIKELMAWNRYKFLKDIGADGIFKEALAMLKRRHACPLAAVFSVQQHTASPIQKQHLGAIPSGQNKRTPFWWLLLQVA